MKFFVCILTVALTGSAIAQPQNPPPGSFDRLSQQQSIDGLTPAQLQRFFNNANSVTVLTSCFADIQSCPNPTASSIANQILNLGPGGSCAPCSTQAQANMDNLVKIFLHNYSTKYPDLYEQVKSYIAHVISN